MFTKRRCAILAAGGLLGLLGLAVFLKAATAGKPTPPPPKPVPWPYSITFLGTLGGDYSIVEAINNLGDVVGWGETSAYTPAWSTRNAKWQVAFVSTVENGVRVMHNLNDLIPADEKPHWYLQSAKAINDLGQIAGSGYHNGLSRAFRYTPPNDLLPAVIEDLGTLGGDGSQAWGINQDGDCTGTSKDANDRLVSFLYTRDDAGNWVMLDIGELDPTVGQGPLATRINLNKQICGSAQVLGVGTHAFRYTPPDTMIDLGVIGVNKSGPYRMSDSAAFDLNDDGVVVGHSTAGGGAYRAFMYTDRMVDLGSLGGGSSKATGINNSGWIVGNASLASGTYHFFLYTPDMGMMDLEPAIRNLPPGMSGTLHRGDPARINDLGVICGTRRPPSGLPTSEAFVLTRQ